MRHHACLSALAATSLFLMTGLSLQPGNGKGGGGGGGGGSGGDPDIVYAASTGLYTMRADGTGKTRISRHIARFPCFSPDGTRIAFSAELEAGRGIYIINRDGSGLRLVTTTILYSPTVSWSPVPAPDGQYKLAFHDQGLGTEPSYDLFTVNLDGSARNNLTATADIYELDPTWSPDARHIAAVRASTELVVYTLAAVGGQLNVSAESSLATGTSIRFPQWAKAHDWIVLSASLPGSSFDLVVIDLNNPAVPYRLTATAETERWASFSPDDSQLVYHSTGSHSLYRINLDGTGRIPLDSKGIDPNWRR